MTKTKTRVSELYKVGLGWDTGKHTGFDIDLHIRCIESKTGKTHHYYYGNKRSADGAIKLSEDNLTGEGEGDDEYAKMKLEKLKNKNIDIIIISAEIYSPSNATFRDIRNEVIRAYNKGGKILAQYELDQDPGYDDCSAIVFASLLKTGDYWEFCPAGIGMRAVDMNNTQFVLQQLGYS